METINKNDPHYDTYSKHFKDAVIGGIAKIHNRYYELTGKTFDDHMEITSFHIDDITTDVYSIRRKYTQLEKLGAF